jgi:hypothetical protein
MGGTAVKLLSKDEARRIAANIFHCASCAVGAHFLTTHQQKRRTKKPRHSCRGLVEEKGLTESKMLPSGISPGRFLANGHGRFK